MRERKLHSIKCAAPFFEEVWHGRKTFEVRLDDRDYQTGDVAHLQQVDWPATRSCIFEIGYVLREFAGLRKGYCAFALLEPSEELRAWADERL